MWLFFFFMYMCKTRGLFTAIFNVSLFSALWRKLCVSSLTRSLNMYNNISSFFFFPKALRRSVGSSERAGGIICYVWICNHTLTGFFLMIILTHIPKNCTSFHFPALQAPLQASLTHSNFCLPRQSYSSVGGLTPHCVIKQDQGYMLTWSWLYSEREWWLCLLLSLFTCIIYQHVFNVTTVDRQGTVHWPARY